MIRVFGHQMTDPIGLAELAGIFFQSEADLSTTLGFLDGFNRVLTVAIRRPLHRICRIITGPARSHDNTISNNKR